MKHFLILLISLGALVPWGPADAETGFHDPSFGATEFARTWQQQDRLQKEETILKLLSDRSEAIDVVGELLFYDDFQMKRLALELAEDLGEGGLAGELLNVAHQDAEPAIRARALFVLGEIGTSENIKQIFAILEQNPEDFIRSGAVYAAGALGDPRHVDALRPWLKDASPLVRVQAAAALARLGDDAGETVLLAALADDDPLVRKWATKSLAHIDTPAVREALEHILSTPEASWKSEALMSAARLAGSLKGTGVEIEMLDRMASSGNRALEVWAVEQLVDNGGSRAAERLDRIAGRDSQAGARARRLIAARGIGGGIEK